MTITWTPKQSKVSELKLWEHNPRTITKEAYARLKDRISKRGFHDVARVHPTQKPIALLSEIIKDYSKDEDIVLDLFGGSGSTLIACEQLGRKCYMMEIDRIYIAVILDRWAKLTGKDPVREDGKLWSELKQEKPMAV